MAEEAVVEETQESQETQETQTPEWAASIEDEGVRTFASKYESQDDALKAIGYKAPKPEDWRTDLPDELKDTAKRFTSKEDAVRAIVNFQKREGQVRVPGKDASEEEVAKFHKAIGVPESPDKYEFPEIPKDQMTEDRKVSRETWGKRLHEHKVPNETAKALIKYLSEDAQKAEVAQAEARAAFVKQQEAALRKEWPGEEFKTNREVANRALGDIVNRTGVDLDELKKVKLDNGNFLLDDARMLKIFANIGRDMSEGTLGPTLTESESESIQEEIEGIRVKISEAQDKGDSKKANKLYEKEQALIARLKGDQPIVGSRGRAA